MKKNYSISVYIIFVATCFIFSNVAQGQNKIGLTEYPDLAKKIKDQVPEGKTLFVFETKEDYSFYSSNEKIVQPKKVGLLYKLFLDIEPASGLLTIQHEGWDEKYVNYGMFDKPNSLPSPKNKEIKYFKLILTSKLLYNDETGQKLNEGASDTQALNETDALIIVNVVPNNLEINISGKQITQITPGAGKYRVYLNPSNHEILLKSKNYEDITIKLDSLAPYDVKYFHVEAPQLTSGVDSYDKNMKIGDYLISSNPPGALIQMFGNPDFNAAGHLTPHTSQYPTGTYIISLTLNDYEPEQDTIFIGSKTRRNKLYKELIPTFAYIKCNTKPGIPISKVSMDGKELTSIENEKAFKCLKGTHNLEISAPHYYSETLQINLAAEKTSEINVKLKPKLGTLTLIPENVDANNARVFIDNIEEGNLPLNKYILIEGEHSLRFEKAKFATSTKSVVIKEKDDSKLNISLLSTIKTTIKSEPSGATIFIDGEQVGTSNLTAELTLGTHSVRLEKDYYENKTESIIIHENDQAGIFSYSLVPLKYPVYVNSKPGNADVSLDGKIIGETSLSYQTSKGFHTFRIDKDHYFPKTFIKNVSSSKTSSISKVLYPKRLFNLNALYGLNSYGISAGGTISYFSLSFDYFPSIKNTVFSTPISHASNSFSYNSTCMTSTNQKISMIDSAGSGWAVKGGFVLLKPFMIRIHAGYGSRSFIYNDVYKVTNDATYSGSGYGGSGTIYKNELIKGSESKKAYFKSVVLGIEIPIRFLNFRADYWLDSERGGGPIFGVGFNIF